MKHSGTPKDHIHKFMAALLLSTSSLTATAMAQSTDSRDGADGAARLDTLVVTARRVEESLQDAPVSVTAFTGDELGKRGVTQLDQIGYQTPNVNISGGRPDGGPSTAQIFIRGVGQTDFLPPTDPGVGLSVDGVFLTRTVGGNLSLIDIERVEVLKGPQGALFGKNSNGGVINIYTTKPTGEWGGKAEITGGSFDRIDAQAVVYFPLIEDVLSGKIVGATANRDGFIDRVYDDVKLGSQERHTVRGQLLWTPSPDVEFLLSGDATFQDQTGAPGNLQVFVPGAGAIDGLFNPVVAPFVVAELASQGITLPAGTVFDDRFVGADFDSPSFGVSPSVDKATIYGFSLQGDWSVSESLAVKSITAYRKIDAEMARDSDRTPFPIISTDDKFDSWQFTQELQLAGGFFDDRLTWLGGVYYSLEKANDEIDVEILDGTLDTAMFEISQTAIGDVETSSISGFGNVNFDITSRLSASVGLRYTHDDKEVFQDVFGLVSGAIIVPPQMLNAKFGFLSSRASLEYDVTDDLMIYASYGRGFKSGGFNNRPTVGDPSAEPFDEEVVTTYEAGFKSEYFDRRLIVNAAVFYSDYKDIQLSLVLPDAGVDGVLGTGDDLATPTIDNIGDSELYGLELEVMARPNNDWEFSANLGLLHNEYKALSPEIQLAAMNGLIQFSDGNKLIDAPEITASASLTRYIELNDMGDFAARVDVNYQSESYNEPQNFEEIKQDDLVLLNASLRYAPPSERWSLTFRGENLLDEQVYVSGINLETLGYFETVFNRPREWSITASVNF